MSKMKNILLAPLFILLIISFASIASADIIITQQPSEIYNLGDSVSVPTTIKASKDISGSLNMDLLCNGKQVNFYKNGISLAYGEEIRLAPAPSLVLTKEIIGETIGDCKIKAVLLDEAALTNEFKISNLINIQIRDKETVFDPGTNVLIRGEAIKENGDAVNGFIELSIILDPTQNETGTITQLETVNNGFFSINLSLPADTKAGNHLLKLDVYEKDTNAEITNKGFTDYNIYINQVPTNLEVAFETQEVEPGTNLKVKAILHDQTGENIETVAIITIKDHEDKILEQVEKPTDEFLEYEIAYNQPPVEWKVVSVSNKLSTEAVFNILEKQEVKVELINKTLTITNIGNVEYCNKTMLVKIGNDSVNIEPCLGIDEVQRYVVTGPEGEYEVEIIREGESILTGNVLLTGKGSVNVKKVSETRVFLARYPTVWIFMILILAVITFIIFKKGYRRSFFGHIHLKKKGKTPPQYPKSLLEKSRAISLRRKPLITPRNTAELSMSIKGDKQNASVICLKIKNLKALSSEKGGASNILQKIVDMVEENKGTTYQNQNNIFFIFAPVKTKTFKNERLTLRLAQKVDNILKDYNKLSKQKINYGISLNQGEIIAKDEGRILKFMTMHRLMPNAKKVAEISDSEVLLCPDMEKKFGSDVKTEKHVKNKVTSYKVKELIDREKHTAFISSFLKRIEEGEKGKKNKERG